MKLAKFIHPFLVICAIGTSFAAINPNIKVGGLYVVKIGNEYHVEKVLALGTNVVHVREYTNTFHTLPAHLDSKDLRPSAEHSLVSIRGFLADKPIKVTQEKVRADELKAYHSYLNSTPNPQ